MPSIRSLQRSFAGGEVSPEMFGRNDDGKYQAGLAKCRNFIVKAQGPAENRAGFAFVNEVKDSTKQVRLIPFTFSTTQTMVIEFGNLYMRFHTAGATLLEASKVITGITQPAGVVTSAAHGYSNGNWVYLAAIVGMTELNGRYAVVSDSAANTFRLKDTAGNYITTGTFGAYVSGGTVSRVYEITSPYAEADLFDIHYVQSADVLTLVHPNYAPRELRRLGATNWTITTISFGSPLATPTAPGLNSFGPGGGSPQTHEYATSALNAAGEESTRSSSSSIAKDLTVTGNYIEISPAAVVGASGYNVYKARGGVFGYLGTSNGSVFVDDNISPDMSQTPPVYETVFNATDLYPGAVSYFEQRRCFAGSNTEQQTIRMTKSGTESNMSYSLPLKDDDRISFRVAAREANTIRHIVPLSELLLLTSAGEWRVTSVNSDAITPSSISVKPQSYIGASNVQPSIVNSSLLYVAARGGHIREMGYAREANGFITGDLSLRAAHLFDNLDVVDMCYSKAPQPLVWFISSNGVLLGLTYVPEQNVGAWHWHDTDGSFESCASVAEGSEDRLYVVAQRSINGREVRYIERQASRQFTDQEDAFFVDCGATYDGAAISTVTGLHWLEGETVSILADGAVHSQQVVTGGAISLENAASVVQVGLPILADLQTLPLAAQIDGGFGQGRVKNVNKAWLRVYRSGGIFVGPDEDHLVEAKTRTTEDYGTPTALKSQEISVMTTASWADAGQVFVRQSDPLPLTVVSLTLEVSVGA